MVQPPPLRLGDQINLLSTARKISYEELLPAIRLMESWGLNVKLGKNLLKEHHQFAGTKAERLDDFQTALDEPNCKAIICARGGYGSIQIIDELNFSAFLKTPKWIVGYSDVTVLHAHINQNFDLESLHATMPVNFPKEGINKACRSLKNALFGKAEAIEFEAKSISILPKENLKAPLVGGNLSILYALSGSKSQLNCSGKFLFLEDLDEYLYHIDRMMMNLKRSGLFEGCKAVLVGGMNDMNDNAVPYGQTAEEIILENLSKLEIPVIFGLPSGHLANNQALILNRRYHLQISKQSVQLIPDGRA